MAFEDLFLPAAIRCHLRDAQRWVDDADIPDPLGRQDLTGRPELVAEVLQERHRRGVELGSRTQSAEQRHPVGTDDSVTWIRSQISFCA